METTEVLNTGSTVSFDDLDSMSSASESAPEPSQNEVTVEPAETTATAPTEASAEGVPADGTAPVDASKAAPAPKTFKVQVGDQAIDLRGDGSIQLPVNGKLETFKVQDLINEFSGKTDWSRKYQDLANEKKAFGTERQGLEQDKVQLKETVTHIYKTFMDDTDPQAAIEGLAEAMGANAPYQTWVTFRNQVFDAHQDAIKDLATALGHENPDLVWKEFKEKLLPRKDVEGENKSFKRREETQRTMTEKTAAVQDIRGRIDKVCETYKVSLEELNAVYQDCLKTGKFKPEDLTPEKLGDAYREFNDREMVNGVLASLGAELDNRETAHRELSKVRAQNPDLTKEDLKEIAQEVFGNKTAKSLSRKVKKAEPTRAKLPPSRSSNQSSVPISFDDL